jgi:dienelactone hydrolase
LTTAFPVHLTLASGAEARVSNGLRAQTVVFLGGGRQAEEPGTWSASNEWLVRRLAPSFPELGFVEVCYRVKSWQQLELCVEDARAALLAAAEAGAERIALVGFSMGGAVAVSAAGHPAVTTVLGLAPWLPDRLPLDPLAGRRFAVIHGSLDRSLPWLPGVTAASSRRAFERARAFTTDCEYTLIRGAPHGAAVRSAWGLMPLPRARRWAELVGRELERFHT